MGHCPAVPRTCQPYMIALAVTLLLAPPSLTHAQAAVGLGFTRQHVSAGNRRESLNGYSLDLAIRIAPRLGLLIGAEQIGHGGSTTRDEFSVQSFRTGLQLLVVRSRVVDLSFSTGVGLHTLELDREEDGAGATAFVQAQVAFHPLPVVGLYIGGIAQSLDGFGRSIGGSTLGFNFGLQLRGDGW